MYSRKFMLVNLFRTWLELWIDNMLLKDFPLKIICDFFTSEKVCIFFLDHHYWWLSKQILSGWDFANRGSVIDGTIMIMLSELFGVLL